MTRKEKIGFGIGILMLVILFVSSSMTYKQQTIVPKLHHEIPWLKNILGQISFTYAGQKHSMELDTYAGFLEFIIRKTAHFGSYFIVGSSFYYALKRRIQKPALPFVLVFLSSIGLAAIDEFHQGLTGGRTPSVYDVMLDASGALTGILLMMLILFIIKKFKGPQIEIQTEEDVI